MSANKNCQVKCNVGKKSPGKISLSCYKVVSFISCPVCRSALRRKQEENIVIDPASMPRFIDIAVDQEIA